MNKNAIRNKYRLTRQQFYDLCEKCKELQKQFQAERPTWNAAARIIQKELDFKIYGQQVQKACQIAEVTWELPRKHSVIGTGGAARKRYDELQHKLTQLQSDVSIIRCLIHDLYIGFQIKPPAGYTIPTDTKKISVINK